MGLRSVSVCRLRVALLRFLRPQFRRQVRASPRPRTPADSISSLPFWKGSAGSTRPLLNGLHLHSQKPAISSLVSVNGPSVTLLWRRRT